MTSILLCDGDVRVRVTNVNGQACLAISDDKDEPREHSEICNIHNLRLVLGGMRYSVGGNQASCAFEAYGDVIQMEFVLDGKSIRCDIEKATYVEMLDNLFPIEKGLGRQNFNLL